ncbi:hypothetical protein FRC15_003141 [Serendipita sp. 397]|nr:hypothetical protein FRC15_003141 [Serendipita sp. 397]
MSRTDLWVRRGHTIAFALLILFSIVEGAITTWITVQYGKNHNYDSISIRDRVRLLVVASWWTVFFGFIYLLLFLHSARTGSDLTSVLSHLIFLGLTWILWTAGAASLTSSLGGGINCSKVDRNVVYCNQLNAAEGFAWVDWYAQFSLPPRKLSNQFTDHFFAL